MKDKQIITNKEKNQNMVKFYNYQEQFTRLKKALKEHFYLEAMFIEYAIMEDRSDAILKYENNGIKSDRFVSIDRKINKIKTISREKKSLPNRYFDNDFLDSILIWKEERNRMIHALMKQSLTIDELEKLALEGQEIARIFCNKATNYRRAVERKKHLI